MVNLTDRTTAALGPRVTTRTDLPDRIAYLERVRSGLLRWLHDPANADAPADMRADRALCLNWVLKRLDLLHSYAREEAADAQG